MSGSHLVLRFKKELQTTNELMELMELMKQVAASQFHAIEGGASATRWGSPAATPPTVDGEAAQPASERTRLWSDRSPLQSALALTVVMEEFFRLIPPDQCAHPFLNPPSDPLGLVMVTSDEGFVGGLNAGVLQAALESPGADQAELIVVGGRGKIYLDDLRRRHTALPGLATTGAVEQLRDHLIEQYVERRLGRVVIFYPAFHSIARQETAWTQLLPYVRPPSSPPTLSPEGREGSEREKGEEPPRTIVEPAGPMVIEYLVALWLGRKIHEVFWQSRQSELAARIMRLESNGQELLDRKRKLKLQYFRAKHELVDSSLRETYAGMLLKAETKTAAEKTLHVGA